MSRVLVLAGYVCMFAAVWTMLQGRYVVAVAFGVFMLLLWLLDPMLTDTTVACQSVGYPNPAFELTQDYLEARREIDEIGHYHYLASLADEVWDDDEFGRGKGSTGGH